MNGYTVHEDHFDHVLVGCPSLCTREFWEYRDVMVVIICASMIIEGLRERGISIKW